MNKKREFEKILKDIKDVKIQGATNIAKSALYAYNLIPTKNSREKLLWARPTEPMLTNVLKRIKTHPYKEIINHFKSAQNEINKHVYKLIKNGDVIFTHCHSTNVVKALIYAKNKGKKFEVYNTETRPLYQGRKTAKELRNAKIKVTMFVDSALGVVLSNDQGTKRVSKVFFGSDAILKKGIINKIGSGVIAKIAKLEKIPVYLISDSWKFSPRELKLEQRNFHEVWGNLSEKSHIKIRNPSFEFVDKIYIKAIISEYGKLKFSDFLKKVRRKNNF